MSDNNAVCVSLALGLRAVCVEGVAVFAGYRVDRNMCIDAGPLCVPSRCSGLKVQQALVPVLVEANY